MKNPIVFNTIEEAAAYQKKLQEFYDMLDAMTPEQRRIYFETVNNKIPPPDKAPEEK